jgi:hypothetical protein
MSFHLIEQGTPSGFDPAQWLSDFATLGGGYVHTGERVAFLTAGVFAPDLTFMMRQIVGRPDRLAAVRAELTARAGVPA